MKRFTETDKWRDCWFRKLPALQKLGFIYVIENCDAAGVWEPDYELANFAIGEEISWMDLLSRMGNRVNVLTGGQWHLTRFVEFQCGELRPECPPHRKILGLLKSHGIDQAKGIERVYERVLSTPKKKTRRRKEEEGSLALAGIPTAEAIYQAYPKKVARPDALRAIEKAIERTDASRLLELTTAYAAAVARWPAAEREFVPNPSTWFNQCRYDDDQGTWFRKGSAPMPRKEPDAIPEPLGWKQYLDAEYPGNVYGTGGAHEAHAWSELPRDLQAKFAGEISQRDAIR